MKYTPETVRLYRRLRLDYINNNNLDAGFAYFLWATELGLEDTQGILKHLITSKHRPAIIWSDTMAVIYGTSLPKMAFAFRRIAAAPEPEMVNLGIVIQLTGFRHLGKQDAAAALARLRENILNDKLLGSGLVPTGIVRYFLGDACSFSAADLVFWIQNTGIYSIGCLERLAPDEWDILYELVESILWDADTDTQDTNSQDTNSQNTNSQNEDTINHLMDI